MPKDLHAAVAARLTAVDQRYTPGRRALVAALEAAGRPVTLPEILTAAPGLAQSSVYRNLAALEQAGVVHRVLGPGDFARYELVEALTEHHHHLVCTDCGSVADVSIPPKLERALERAIGDVAADAGFEVDAHRLDLLGRCDACAARQRRGAGVSRAARRA